MVSVNEKDQAFSKIRKSIVEASKEFLAAFHRDWAGETMYGFLLETSCEGDRVEAIAASEEGLLRSAQAYTKHYGQTGEPFTQEMRIQLRWGSPEDGWYENYDAGFFENANQVISEAHEAELIEIFDLQLQQMCLDALKELDSDQVFGVGKEREKIVIGICYVGGDNSEEEFLKWAESVNPPTVIEQLRTELKAADDSYQATQELERKWSEA